MVSEDVLKSFVLRAERLEEDKEALLQDLSDLFKEAKDNGFDVKILKQLLKLRKLEESKRREEECLLDLYKNAIGMN